MITPLYYFKWMFQIYALMMAGMCICCFSINNIIMCIIFMMLTFLFGFIADDVIGMDIWRLEREV